MSRRGPVSLALLLVGTSLSTSLLVPAALAVSPDNDDFADAVAIGALPFTDDREITDATLQAGEPQPTCGSTMKNSMWYTFTPSAAMTLHANAFTNQNSIGHHFVVAAYTGGSIGSLVQVACTAGYTNTINFAAVAGTAYHFQVGSRSDGPDSGVVRFRLLEPPAAPVADPPCAGGEVFADNFDGDNNGLDKTSTNNWVATQGTFDVLGAGFFDSHPGNGNYVDLDGGQFGVPADSFIMRDSPVTPTTSGAVHCIQFELAGSNHGDGLNVVYVSFGTYEETFALPSSQGFTVITRQVVGAAGDKLAFHNDGRDWEGSRLDRVRVTRPAAPPPPSQCPLISITVIGITLVCI